MKTITTTSLLNMSLDPIKRALSRAIVRFQLRSMDRHIDVLRAQIKNDHRALAAIEKDRAVLARRLI